MKNDMKQYHLYRPLKRFFDIFLSLFGILVLSWLMIIVFIINIFSSHGRPFYVDKRVGRWGRPLGILKFTSMKKDADTHPEKYFTKEQMKQWKKERKVPNDPRITKFGKFIRKTSLDELPQLFNVLIGQISIVGPRPITERELKLNFTKEEREKLLSVKPGLTGNWAVNGRNACEYSDHRRQSLELEYIDKVSFRTDIKIILKTFLAVLNFKNTH
jgi:lipopolysaccharide/colanic/teichoic acid biosynthesis glycosyltransferase